MYKTSLAIALILTSFFIGAFSTLYESPLNPFLSDIKSAVHALNHQLSDGDTERLQTQETFILKDAPVDEIDDVPMDRQYLLFLGGDGFNLEGCPEQGCLAWIQDRQGNLLHTWPNHQDPIPNLDRHEKGIKPPSFRPTDAKLLKNGNLLVNYQVAHSYPYAGGMVLYDRNGAIVWSKYDWNHHWLNVSNEKIYSPKMALSPKKLTIPGYRHEIVCDEDVLVDLLAEYNMSGELIRELNIINKLAEEDWLGTLFRSDIDRWAEVGVTNEFCDPTHLNFVEIVPENADGELIQPGDFILSLRSNSSLILMDGDLDRIKKVVMGRTIYQHSPRYYKEDKIVVFDNQGGASAPNISRLLEIDMSTMDSRVIYPNKDTVGEEKFHSTIAGYVGMNDSRTHALAVATIAGRVLEINLETGEKTWEYCHKIGEKRCKRKLINMVDYVDHSIVEQLTNNAE